MAESTHNARPQNSTRLCVLHTCVKISNVSEDDNIDKVGATYNICLEMGTRLALVCIGCGLVLVVLPIYISARNRNPQIAQCSCRNLVHFCPMTFNLCVAHALHAHR